MAQWNRDTPWRQAHLLDNAAIEGLGLHDAGELERTLVIVATHDCDLVQAPESEPHVEVIVGCLTAKGHKLHEKIAKAVQPHGDLISGVFFDVDQGVDIHRNGPDDTYTLDIIVLHTADPDFEAAERAAASAARAIEAAFRGKLFALTKRWQEIELRSCDAVSESVLTYQQFKVLKRWRLEYISLAAEPQQRLLSE